MEAGMMSTLEPLMTPSDTNTQTIGDIIAFQTTNFTKLNQALTDAGLLDTLKDPNAKYILFAPTDAALAAAPQDMLNSIMADPAQLKALLLNHVVDANAVMNNSSMLSTAEPGMMATQDMMGTMEPGMTGTMEPGGVQCMAWTPDMMGTMEPGMAATQDMMGTMEPGMAATADMSTTPGMMGTSEPNMMNQMNNVPTLGGLTLSFENYDNCLTVNGINVIGKVAASNGYIFVIDGVLTNDTGMMGTMEPGMTGTMESGAMATAEATKQP